MSQNEFPPPATAESTEPDPLRSEYVLRHVQWIPTLAFVMVVGFAMIYVFVL